MQNNLHELWALLNLVAPQRFHSLTAFVDKYGNPPETTAQLEALQEALRPYLLGRKKADVDGLSFFTKGFDRDLFSSDRRLTTAQNRAQRPRSGWYT